MNTQLEEIGLRLGGTDSLATLSVLSWSMGFALGGALTQATANSAGARRAAMTLVAVANLLFWVWGAVLDRGAACRARATPA